MARSNLIHPSLGATCLAGSCTRVSRWRARQSLSPRVRAHHLLPVPTSSGHYRIDNIPPGQYVPAVRSSRTLRRQPSAAHLIFPIPITVQRRRNYASYPRLSLRRHRPLPLPAPLPEAVDLWARRAGHERQLPFPSGASGLGTSICLHPRKGLRIISLRLYRPFPDSGEKLPLLFGLFPGWVDDWAPVNVALADAGYTVLGAVTVRRLGIGRCRPCRGRPRRFGTLARGGHLGVDLADVPAVALGGSFSSAMVNRLYCETSGDQFVSVADSRRHQQRLHW